MSNHLESGRPRLNAAMQALRAVNATEETLSEEGVPLQGYTTQNNVHGFSFCALRRTRETFTAVEMSFGFVAGLLEVQVHVFVRHFIIPNPTPAAIGGKHQKCSGATLTFQEDGKPCISGFRPEGRVSCTADRLMRDFVETWCAHATRASMNVELSDFVNELRSEAKMHIQESYDLPHSKQGKRRCGSPAAVQ